MIQGPVRDISARALGVAATTPSQGTDKPDPYVTRRTAHPELPPEAQRFWQKVGSRPAYIEDVPSDATKSVLDLVVQDAERIAREQRGEQSNYAQRCKYYARRLGTLLAESERRGDDPDACFARLTSDPYIRRVTPELTREELDVVRKHLPGPASWADLVATYRALRQGAAAELAVQPLTASFPGLRDMARCIASARHTPFQGQTTEGGRLFLFASVVLVAPPTWDMKALLAAYNAEAAGIEPEAGALRMTREDLDLLLAQHPWVRDDYEEIRFAFRGRLKRALADAPTGRSLGDIVRDVCSYETPSKPGYELEVGAVLDYLHGDAELQRLLNANLGEQLLGMHAAVLPRLARWVKRIYGEHLGEFSVLEIADRMQREDPAFTPSLIAELFVRCPDIMGHAPEAQTRRNFLLAVTVATTMQRMWTGATYDDVVAFLKALGPHGDVPPGFDVRHLQLLQSYTFVPTWENGTKPARPHLVDRHLGELADKIAHPLRLLPRNLAMHVRREIAQLLEQGGPPDRNRVDGLVSTCFRIIALNSAVALLDRFSGICDPATKHYIFDCIGSGRYRELIDDPVWRAGFQAPSRANDRPMGFKVPDQLLELVRDFHEAERALGDAVELAMFRQQAASAAMFNIEKIPRVMPITQGVVDHIKDAYRAAGKPLPFSKARVVMVQHELGQAYPQVEAYKALGMDPAKCVFVGKPYHPNPGVEQTLLQVSGVGGRFSERGDLAAMRRKSYDAVDRAIAERADDEVVLIVGDGPDIRAYVERAHLADRPELARWIRFTEQTSIGHRASDVNNKSERVVSYARVYQKIVEAPYIARSSRRAIEAVLANLRDTLENKVVWVNGLAGTIGRAAAEALIAAGARVAGWDPKTDAATRAWAKERGIAIYDDDSALPPDVFAIVGASGSPSINAAQLDKTKARSDGGPVYIISLSSERVEVDYAHLQERATDSNGVVRKMVATMVNDQPTFYYWFNDGSVRAVMADTLPVNFQDVNSVAPEAIDATMALSVAAGAEALESEELGFFSASSYVGVVEAGYAAYIVRAGGAPTTS